MPPLLLPLARAGVEKNLYFVTHSSPELVEHEGHTRTNPFEAQVLDHILSLSLVLPAASQSPECLWSANIACQGMIL